MRVTKSTILLLMFVLMLSIFVANVADLINIDQHITDDILLDERGNKALPKFYEIGESPDNLMWFLQISDLHISVFRDQTRISEFIEFCNITVDAISPPVVLASGDLTDAKAIDRMGSDQVLEEWKHYKRVLDESNIGGKTLWLDVRGNHDNFNVLNINAKNNYYTNYSMQGNKHSRSYMYNVHVGTELYTFIAVDACLQPGPKRPFNFIGVLDEKEINKIQDYAHQSKESNVDYIIWFGHYPTSCILSQGDTGVRNIIGKHREGLVYLCGHYHTLGGMVPNMYTLQHAGFLELELADWKDNRMYRLAAIDHGQFSFIDLKHGVWPVALITNPKHALFMIPYKENLQSVIQSTHIRVLAFSTAAIKLVEVKLDDNNWMTCRHIKGPLYAAPWNTSDYRKDVHNIKVRVVDTEGRERHVSQPFSLDGTRLPFSFLPRFLLMSNASHVFLFGTMLILVTVPLCIFRFVHILCEGKRMRRPRIRSRCLYWTCRKLWVLSTVDRLFFPLVFYALYLTIGPWTIGEVIENHMGVIFAWGTIIGKYYLPGAFTYVYGFFQLFSFHLPLIIILAHLVDKRLQYLDNPSRKRSNKIQLLWRHLPFILLISMQMVMAYFFWLAYGTIATLLCPLRTWSIILALILWVQVYRMPHLCLRSAAAIWCSNG